MATTEIIVWTAGDVAIRRGRKVATAGVHPFDVLEAIPEDVARVQGFPSGFQWPAGSEAAHRLIGNAVPPQLGEAVGRAIRNALGL